MKIKPLKIGNLTVDFPVMLAPMAGYTDTAFRSLCRDFHCGMLYTEVINARGIVHDSKQTFHLLETSESERPIAAHIYGSEPEIFAQAAAIIEKMNCYDTIDINCGCPVRKIVSKGAGAHLIREPNKIYKIISAITKEVSMPVTIKTRIGPSPDNLNIMDVLHAAQDAGAAAIAIHARFSSAWHRGPADWETLARVKEEASIPVLGNGGINIANDAFRMFKETNVDGVLIGRAAVGNPWIFDEIYCKSKGEEYKPHSLEEHRDVMIDHLTRLTDLKKKHPKYEKAKFIDQSDEGASLHFRGHLFKYMSGFHGWNRIKKQLNEMRSPETIIAAIDSVLAEQKIPDMAQNLRHTK